MLLEVRALMIVGKVVAYLTVYGSETFVRRLGTLAWSMCVALLNAAILRSSVPDDRPAGSFCTVVFVS